MMNRKTKRHSPPPYQTTATVDHKTVDNSFSKWTKVLQLLSPPHKKRRAGMTLIDQQNEEEEEQVVPLPTTIVTKREQTNKQQKLLNRRAMYIPNDTTIVTDGPQDSNHQWSLYRATHQKLRRNSLPLSESLHLRKMLVTLQHQLKNNKKSIEDEEDNVPLGTLLEKSKRPPSPPRPLPQQQQQQQQRMVVPPSATMKAFYHKNKRSPSPQQPSYSSPQQQLSQKPLFYKFNNRSFPSPPSPPVQYTTF